MILKTTQRRIYNYKLIERNIEKNNLTQGNKKKKYMCHM